LFPCRVLLLLWFPVFSLFSNSDCSPNFSEILN
jgi:hypothetical protein